MMKNLLLTYQRKMLLKDKADEYLTIASTTEGGSVLYPRTEDVNVLMQEEIDALVRIRSMLYLRALKSIGIFFKVLTRFGHVLFTHIHDRDVVECLNEIDIIEIIAFRETPIPGGDCHMHIVS